MITYSKKGFKCIYPKHLKKKSDFPFFHLNNSKTKDLLQVSLHPKEWNLFFTQSVRMPASIKKDPTIEIIREGNLSVFPNSKEILFKRTRNLPSGESICFYNLIALLSVGKRIVEVNIITNKEDDIYEMWEPILRSFDFDDSQFESQAEPITTSLIKTHVWTKAPLIGKSKHIKHTLHPENAVVSLYDSTVKYFPEKDFDDNFESTKILKINKEAILGFSDALNIVVDLYLNKDLPDIYISNSEWVHIVESVICIDSGQLYLNASGEPEIKIKIKNGCYAFRVYFGAVDAKKDTQNCHIYFWETDMPETNGFKILKQSIK